ncbi:MAG: glycoside hydrolase family 3 protein [Desulfovibrionaceae bacterium]
MKCHTAFGRRSLLWVLLFILSPLAACADPPPLAGSGGPASLEAMAGQMIMVGFRGTDLPDDAPVLRDLRELNLGGVVLFDRDVVLKSDERNVRDPAQLARLSARLREAAVIPPFLAIDQEGGMVARLKPERGFPPTISAAELGRKGDLGRTRAAGRDIGATLRAAGINTDFAPVVDLDFGDKSPAIGRLGRSFSADPAKAAAHALAFIDGLHRENVLSCLKHFPGHGSASGDTHHGFTDVTSVWSRKELIPFQRVIEAGAADMVMTAHVTHQGLDPDHPATFSRAVVTDLLRGELGFDGVVVTDDLQMGAVAGNYGLREAVRLSVQAGADLLLFGNNLRYDPEVGAKAASFIVEMVRRGEIKRERLEASWKRIMRLKARLMKRPGE